MYIRERLVLSLKSVSILNFNFITPRPKVQEYSKSQYHRRMIKDKNRVHA